jgi:hypothetical protein
MAAVLGGAQPGAAGAAAPRPGGGRGRGAQGQQQASRGHGRGHSRASGRSGRRRQRRGPPRGRQRHRRGPGRSGRGAKRGAAQRQGARGGRRAAAAGPAAAAVALVWAAASRHGIRCQPPAADGCHNLLGGFGWAGLAGCVQARRALCECTACASVQRGPDRRSTHPLPHPHPGQVPCIFGAPGVARPEGPGNYRAYDGEGGAPWGPRGGGRGC